LWCNDAKRRRRHLSPQPPARQNKTLAAAMAMGHAEAIDIRVYSIRKAPAQGKNHRNP
jgi:hypothetical protein